jgi:hypothetical protein
MRKIISQLSFRKNINKINFAIFKRFEELIIVGQQVSFLNKAFIGYEMFLTKRLCSLISVLILPGRECTGNKCLLHNSH